MHNTKYVNNLLAAIKQECDKKRTNTLTTRDIRKRIDLGGLYTLIERGYLSDAGYDDSGQLLYIFDENGKNK